MENIIAGFTVSPDQISALMPSVVDGGGAGGMIDEDLELLGGLEAKKEREIIEGNRVKLANYIHDVTTLFPPLRQAGIFNRDDVDIVQAPVTTTAKVDKCLDVLLRKGPKAIGVFHEALRSNYRHLFNYLAQLFTQAGITLPPSRQMKDDKVELEEEVNPLDIRHSRSNSTYRNGSRGVTIRKRLEAMSRQCEMMEKEKNGLQRVLGDREREISSLLSTKDLVQTSLNNVQGKYQELLSQLTQWRAVLESDDAVKQWAVERENIQREYDQMEQEYNLQCSELNAAKERISLLLQQLERSEKVVSITQETFQKEKDVLKHKITVLEGEIQRLRGKLDYVMATPTTVSASSSEGKVVSGESAVTHCEKLQHDLERANDQISSLNEKLEVARRERRQAYIERDELTQKLYEEKRKAKDCQKQNKQLKIQIDSISNTSDPVYSPQTPHKGYPGGVSGGGVTNGSFPSPAHTMPPMRYSSCPTEDIFTPRGAGLGGGATVKVENMEVFMPAPTVDDLGMKLELGVVVRELKEGSQPHKHGIRLGDEICQVNKFTLYGDDPLDFFNHLLKNATEPVALILRRQVAVQDTRRPYNTLPAQLPYPTPSPHSSRPISPCFPPSLPLNPTTSSVFPLNPQLGAATLSRKSPAFQLPPVTGTADSPVNVGAVDTSLGGKTPPPRVIGRVSTDGTSTSTHSTNKDFFSSSSSDEDMGKCSLRRPVLITQQRRSNSSNRLSATSEQSGIVGSPTERNAPVWKDNRLTRISTIDSGFEFPFIDDGDNSFHDENLAILDYENWHVVESVEQGDKTTEEEGRGEEEREGEGEGEAEGEGEGEEKKGNSRMRRRAVGNDRWSGPRRQKGYHNRNRNKMSKSLDDLNEHGKPQPVRRQSRNGERTVVITKEEFQSQIKLIGGRGYGMFIETDSRRHTVETGDRIIEVCDKSATCLTRAAVFELLEARFSRSEPANLTVLYDAKSLSELPPHAKDDFYVKCTQCYRPTHSLLTKNNDIAFEKDDVLHITNTLPTGHRGYWQAEKVGSKGEIQAVGLVPVSLSPADMTDDTGTSASRFRNSPKSSPKCNKKTNSLDSRSDGGSGSHSVTAFQLYKPVRRVEVQDPRPLLLLGVMQKDIRKYITTHSSNSSSSTGSGQEDIKFCFPTREEASKLEQCPEDEIVERLHEKERVLISTTSHIREMAREGYHCVLCCEPEGLPQPGLQSLMPIVLLLHASAVRTVNKLRQRLPQDGEFNAQEEIDYVGGLKRYMQYFTGQIELQGSMTDVLKEIKATVARQQRSVVWENDTL